MGEQAATYDRKEPHPHAQARIHHPGDRRHRRSRSNDAKRGTASEPGLEPPRGAADLGGPDCGQHGSLRVPQPGQAEHPHHHLQLDPRRIRPPGRTTTRSRRAPGTTSRSTGPATGGRRSSTASSSARRRARSSSATRFSRTRSRRSSGRTPRSSPAARRRRTTSARARSRARTTGSSQRHA